MALGSSRSWLRGGLLVLAALQVVVSVWQYVFPQSFYDDFPTVNLDPPYNEHLVSDLGGLGLGLTAMLFFAAWVFDTKVVRTVLVGYVVYSAAHLVFHLRHLEHFSTHEAVQVGLGLSTVVVLALVLLYLTRRVRR